jgi:nucleoside-diphosphate-sugar epimerase
MSTSSQKLQRVLVLGGNGYVGQHICHAALLTRKYIVQSLSRSGRPAHPSPCLVTPLHLPEGYQEDVEQKTAAINQVEWLHGDIFDAKRRNEVFPGVDVIVSTIGAFGSNAFMERICGDATIEAVDSAVQHSVSKFGFVSSAQVGRTTNSRFSTKMPLYGYFRGKEKAEDAIRRAFPDSHLILRPGFIYGPRMAGSIGPLPLQLIGEPINFVSTRLGPISSLIQAIPFVGTECSNMVHVNAVSRAMIQLLTDDDPDDPDYEDGDDNDMKRGFTLSAKDIRRYEFSL